ncbi:hypothetical protein QAD02_020118 [Eretmocerus hayati]|uniref:Uncharacterized protein n=1 Tax=Eretmocerus hayati TaxID=131215 RepID=A0ACC2PND6_9HYME|nr:hypothetical protein QAD02_020118 [Eretmocerus hayati]
MVQYCIVPNCKANRAPGHKSTVFRVPPDPVARELWRHRIGLSHLNDNSRVCYRHFQDEDIQRESVYYDQLGNIIYQVPLLKPRLKKGGLSLEILQVLNPGTNLVSAANSYEQSNPSTDAAHNSCAHAEPILIDLSELLINCSEGVPTQMCTDESQLKKPQSNATLQQVELDCDNLSTDTYKLGRIPTFSVQLDSNVNLSSSIGKNVEIMLSEDVSMDKINALCEKQNLHGNHVVHDLESQHSYSLIPFMAGEEREVSSDSVLNANQSRSPSDTIFDAANEAIALNSKTAFTSNGNKEVPELKALSDDSTNKRRNSVLGSEIIENSVGTADNVSTNPNKRLKCSMRELSIPSVDISHIMRGGSTITMKSTKHLPKIVMEQPRNSKVPIPGQLVWAYFSPNWWPALVVKAEDVGMLAHDNKAWVYWIGDSRISELDRKRIDCSSKGVKERFDQLSTDSDKKVWIKKQKQISCFKLIQLLKGRFTGGTLKKPYTCWLEKNILPHKHKLDNIVFDPYPEDCLTNLKNFKIINSQKTKRYLNQQSKKGKEVTISNFPHVNRMYNRINIRY